MLSRNNKEASRKTKTALLLLLTIISQIACTNAAIPNTIKRIGLTIDLGNDVTTEAEITIPTVGEGPYPAVLLVPGGGLTDMDEYAPASATTTGEPVALMKRIAEYLSERGFIVLRYDKRGIKRNATMADYGLYSKATVDTFKADAEKALMALKNNPMTDTNDITVLGHSESSIIVTRMAQDDPDITKIVMLGGAARDYLAIKHTQIVELRILFAETVLDQNNDGQVSLDEAITGMSPYENAILPKSSLLMNTGNQTTWIPTWDPNGDGYMDIIDEFQPVLERIHSILSNPSYAGYNQTQAHVSWGATMEMIGDLNASILILQGEGDWQTPPIEAILLEQALIDADQRDHTLITYPGLSHFFYPTDGWQMAIGPMEPIVLRDLYEWLSSPMRRMDIKLLEYQRSFEAAQELEEEQTDAINTINQSLTTSIAALENEINQPKTTDYLIPVGTVLLVLLITTLGKIREK